MPVDKLRTIIATAAGAGAISLALWVGLLRDNRSEANVPRGPAPAAPVITAPVAFEAEVLRLEAVGTSRASRSVTLFPEAAGEIVAVAFEDGQFVEAGDLLLSLDSRDEKLAVELAEVRVTDAERLLDRYMQADGTGALPINDRQAAETALATARIELQRARVAYDDRFVRAPFAGYVGLTDVEPGDRIDPATTITTLDDRSALLVSFEVPELMLGAVRKGEQVDVQTWNRGGPQAAGEVVDVGSRIDPETRTIQARARVGNPEDALRPGMSFRVQLVIEGDRFPVVPEVAVQWGADGAYVWTVIDGAAQRASADVVQRLEGRVLLDLDLPEGAPIVVEGIQSMRAGRKVEASEFGS
ncbi:MAG: efflux RND transporter periplasmic adaptor subunit [Pseudomonadota bacterium]